jgi:hypothetical protein
MALSKATHARVEALFKNAIYNAREGTIMYPLLKMVQFKRPYITRHGKKYNVESFRTLQQFISMEICTEEKFTVFTQVLEQSTIPANQELFTELTSGLTFSNTSIMKRRLVKSMAYCIMLNYLIDNRLLEKEFVDYPKFIEVQKKKYEEFKLANIVVDNCFFKGFPHYDLYFSQL